jgi:hypothetical protein
MEIPNNTRDKKKVDVEDIKLNEPTVDIGKPATVNDSVTVSIDPIEYRRKKLHLQWFAMCLVNGPVAYLGNTEFRIEKCMDYFYNLDPGTEDAVIKSVASATALGDSCAVLADSEKNTYVCSLNSNIWYSEVHTPDDFSSQYGGLTYLETKGRQHISNLWLRFIVTSDGYILTPIKNGEDFVANNAYFYRVRGSFTEDYATYLVHTAKTGELEMYVTGRS